MGKSKNSRRGIKFSKASSDEVKMTNTFPNIYLIFPQKREGRHRAARSKQIMDGILDAPSKTFLPRKIRW